MAVFELWARREGEPLWRVLGGRSGEIQSGVSIGLQRDDAALVESVAREVAAGYRRIKIKIKPGRDSALVEAVRRRFPDAAADGRREQRLHARRRRAAGRARRLRPHDDRAAARPGTTSSTTRRCRSGSGRRSAWTSRSAAQDDARRALDLGACRIVNIKVGRVGGFAASARGPRPLPRARRAGLVRRHARVRDRPARERAPADAARLRRCPATPRRARATSRRTSSTRRWWSRRDGTIAVPERPGIGHDVVWSRVERATDFREDWRA